MQSRRGPLRFTTAVTRDPERAHEFLDRHGPRPVAAFEAIARAAASGGRDWEI